MSENKQLKVAVIAVHGVGYCDPGNSADRVSGLLLGLNEDGRPKYDPIVTDTVHIPLRPLVIKHPFPRWDLGLAQKAFNFLEERTSYLTRQWRTQKKSKVEQEGNAEVADDFMRLTLQDYPGAAKENDPKGADNPSAYITTRLKTARIEQNTGTTGNVGAALQPNFSPQVPPPPPNTGTCEKNSADPGKKKTLVHVYEMYWADLSRPNKSIASFFWAMYQLLFHLASLSRLAISTGYLENQGLKEWRWLDRIQNYAVRMLRLPIPILNVFLFATLFGLIPRLFTSKGVPIADPLQVPAAIGAMILGLCACALYAVRWPNAKRSPIAWALYPFTLGIVLAGIAYFAEKKFPYHVVLSIEGLAVGGALVYLSVAPYDDVRDGAKEVAIGLGGAWAVLLVLCWTCFGHATSVQQATLYAMQIILAALRVSWTFLFIFSIAASAIGCWACRRVKRTGNMAQYARARAAVRTSRLALAVPTLGLFIVTLAFWSAIFVKTSGNKGQDGNSLAVRLFGSSVNELGAGPRLLRSMVLPDREIVRRYLSQIPAPFTVKTEAVTRTTAVNISATDNANKITATTTLIVNPPNLNLSPTTVTGGSDSTGTVVLSGPDPTNRTIVTLSSEPNDKSVTLIPERLIVAQGLAVAPSEASPQPRPPTVDSNGKYSIRPNEYFQGLMVWSATPGFWVALLVMSSGFFLLVLWALPSAFTERKAPIRAENFDSVRLGDWLSRGLDSTKIVTWLMWSAAFVLLTVFAAFYLLAPVVWLGKMQFANYIFVSGTAAILQYIGLAASSLSILTALVGSGSSVLGIILDVDNYLRTSPSKATPRARIAERYVSLLRYVSDYKDPCIPNDTGYDRVVIMAHSLGALITADLLRFLKSQDESNPERFYFNGATPAPGKPKIQLRLFTVGNPLRQLLNRFFPYLYEWVNPLPDNSLNPLKRDRNAPPPGIASNAMPDPNLLEVERWVSAYRSGDYVGRSLWLDEWYDREVPPRANPKIPNPVYVATENPPGRREEMCIGAGAHQHYWDQSAPDIAEKLDELISP